MEKSEIRAGWTKEMENYERNQGRKSQDPAHDKMMKRKEVVAKDMNEQMTNMFFINHLLSPTFTEIK